MTSDRFAGRASRALTVLLVLAASAVLTTSCSVSAGPKASPRTTTTTAPPVTSVPTTSLQTTTTPFYELGTRSVGGLGTVLVDGQGLTLYMFEPDKRSGKSACYDECENLWPPLLLVAGAKAALAGAGVNASLLGATERVGGLEQITYNGWPLYLWHGDTLPGQATGQGLNNSGGPWYVLNPYGMAVITAP
jgi:predicted lipoprotein with Yx(FWY)xxD motif